MQDLKPKRAAKTHGRPTGKVLVNKVPVAPDNIGAATDLPDFDEVEGSLAKYLRLVSTNPSKDAAAFQKVIAETTRPGSLSRAASGGSTSAPPRKGHAVRQPARGTKMVKDDRNTKSGTALMAERRPRSPKLNALLKSVLDQPEKWMTTPSIQFGGRCPAELVGTEEEVKILDILRAVDQGLF